MAPTDIQFAGGGLAGGWLAATTASRAPGAIGAGSLSAPATGGATPTSHRLAKHAGDAVAGHSQRELALQCDTGDRKSDAGALTPDRRRHKCRHEPTRGRGRVEVSRQQRVTQPERQWIAVGIARPAAEGKRELERIAAGGDAGEKRLPACFLCIRRDQAPSCRKCPLPR